MVKRIFLILLGLIAVAGAIAGVKVLQIRKMIDQGKTFAPPPETVTTATVRPETWESALSAVGSLVAVQGVTVAAEVPGRIVHIGFESGGSVKAGDLLLRLSSDTEEAQLKALEATIALAKLSLDRQSQLSARDAGARADYDAASARYKEASAQAESLRAVIAKKHIRAPFTGRLGLRQVNLGQILAERTPVVELQSLDPLYVNFSLPQQQVESIQTGLPVRVTSDALPGEASLEGAITALSPAIDASTRNLKIQATLANPGERLLPGMSVNVTVVLPARTPVLVLPATAVLYAPYGDSVFVVEEKPDEKSGKAGLVLRQQFVKLGAKRGDFVAIASGAKEGETVVSTGVFKLRNGQAVVVDNTLAPEFRLTPKPENK